MIPDEVEDIKESKKEHRKMSKKVKEEEKQGKAEGNEEDLIKRNLTEENLEQEKEESEQNKQRCLTIWNLPSNINEKEIRYMCRSFKDTNIMRVKRSSYKALAVIEVSLDQEKDISWALPLGNNKLARVTEGNEDYHQRDKQGQNTAKLLDVPKGASEVLLLRCLKSKGAKAVYIPHNRNGNQKKFAIITFANALAAEEAQITPIWYNNH